MRSHSRFLFVAAAALVAAASFGSLPARAQEDNALQQLQDVEHSSNDAANAQSDEQAKDLSNQGFDTPNTDPAPSDDDSDPNC